MRLLLLILTALLSFVQPALADNASLPPAVSAALKAAGIPSSSVSVFVQRVDANAPMIQYQANKALNPASVMKLVSTYSGLELLGSAFRWKTEVYTDGKLSNGVLQGNLYIKGYGDPSMMAEDFWRLLGNLRQMGIKHIEGNLVLDNSYFKPESMDASAFDNEPYRAYNTLPSALVLNLNATSFRFSAEDGEANIRPEPDLAEIKVVNQLKVVNQACGDWKSKLRYDIKPDAKGATVTFSGKLGADCTEKYLDLSLFDSTMYTHLLFKKIWHQLGGSISGGLSVEKVSSNAIKLMQQDSKTLADVVRDINKYSNNLIARQLFLTIAAEKIGAPATETEAAQAISTWLNSKGLSFNELSIENGSGLSRTDRISAEHLGALLLAAYNSPVMPELMSSLPILSVDGTVEKRLKDSASKGRAHLKTGSLNDVFTIAGYVLDKNNRRWVIVFMANHAKAAASKPAQDALIEWLYQAPPNL